MDKKLAKYIRDYRKKKNMENKLEVRWLNMFLHLADFKSKHGHTNVPARHTPFKPLGYWVRRQRLIYHQGTLEPEREMLLKTLGFKFRLLEVHNWKEMVQRLTQFKQQYGHVHITENYRDKQLYNWLTYQRKLYWKGKLSKDILIKLKELGVDMRNKTLNQWEVKYNQLAEFKKKHGHLYVCRTYTDNKQLINFVKVIRRDRKKLSHERLKKLNDIGFIWNPGMEVIKTLNRERADETWMQRYKELKEYKKSSWALPCTNKKQRASNIGELGG